MKFLTLLVIAGVSLMLSVKNRQEDKCHLFNGSERPRDTLTLNVTYIGLVLLPPNNNTLSYMEKKKLL